jgi:hypothetical protein
MTDATLIGGGGGRGSDGINTFGTAFFFLLLEPNIYREFILKLI